MNISKNFNNADIKSNNKYQNLKFKLRASFRKGRNYLRNERKRLSLALDRSFSRSENAIDNNKRKSGRVQKALQSDFEVDYVSALELLNETSKDLCVKRQLEQTVSICRQLPEFEASSEMVEAERLLLYSTLKENSFCKSDDSIPSHHSPPKDFCSGIVCVTSFEIPIKPDIHYDAFFNYFYIGVFTHDKDIRSTQSAEKVDNAVFFPNCNMMFDELTANFEINVDLYVLRLRKLSAPPIYKENVPIKIRKSSLSDSREEVVSRFRMHGNFIMRAQDLGPYEVKSKSDNITQNSEFSLVANNLCSLPISLFSRNINLTNEVWLTANIVYNFKNFDLRGFLNVGDIKNKHDWNKRWCQVDALTLYFWNYPQDCSEIPPILTVNLAKCVSCPIKSASREICPKPRSFDLNIATDEIIDGECATTDTFLFSTESQEEFGYWVNGLNDVIEFIRTWKVQVQ